MRRLLVNQTTSAGMALMGMLLMACGETTSEDTSAELEWIQSRSNTARFAYLTREDLDDTFLLGASVIEVDDFHSGALNMTIRPLKVKLKMSNEASGSRLLVQEQSRQETLFAFDLNTYRGYWEIDFASAGNDVKLQQLVSKVGGVQTAMDRDAFWLSQGPPEVKRVQQDDDTMVVDLMHSVQLVKLSTSIFGRTHVSEVLSERPGKVGVRLWLQRQKPSPFLVDRSVALGKSHHVGFFGASFVPDASTEHLDAIQRFDTSETITFYLKDVPNDFRKVARQAVLSWNDAFGYQAITVRDAPEHVDAGDPRYHVIKWFDGTDKNLGWAGVAKMIVDPDSGLVLSGTVYIQGSSLLDLYRGIVDYSEQMSDHQQIHGSLGGADFGWDEGETPVIPFLTDVEKDFDSYMQGYYLETIAHEVGHVLGLRHNFMGSAFLDEHGQSASVMDYLPRKHRATYHGPGTYDVAAIRWGYFGELPSSTQPFCTDDDVWQLWNCSKGDFDDPIDYVVSGMEDGVLWVSTSPIPVTDDAQISSMAALVEQAMKMWRLRDQMPSAERLRLERQLPDAYDKLRTTSAPQWLSASERAIVEANLRRMNQLIEKKLASLPPARSSLLAL